MRVITVDNVNNALPAGLALLKQIGVLNNSRNGGVLVAPCPVTTVYTKPWQRVLFGAVRDANPFFHLFESLWMLAGRNDNAFVERYNARMATFSDDGSTQNGAYGYRWRQHFFDHDSGYPIDQLKLAADMLRKDPSTRRCVLGMWNPDIDLENQGSKDLPCNTHVYFDASKGTLDMLVCCRSNDIVWGAYGANAVHMSVLHEWMAAAIGLQQGTYYQMSFNYHAYITREDVKRLYAVLDSGRELVSENRYEQAYLLQKGVSPVNIQPLCQGLDAETFLQSCEYFCKDPNWRGWQTPFFKRVVEPMAAAHRLYKESGPAAGAELLHSYCGGHTGVGYVDWTLAALEWLQRRAEKSMQNTATDVSVVSNNQSGGVTAFQVNK